MRCYTTFSVMVGNGGIFLRGPLWRQVYSHVHGAALGLSVGTMQLSTRG